jgi:AraC-like DNA-binding protein
MKPLDFLRSPEAQQALERAARAAGMPMSIHYIERRQEGLRIAGWGACDTCAAVAQAPGGRAACRASRMAASGLAVEQGRPIGFVCHMGLSCTSIALLEGEGFVATLGPYAPTESPGDLEHDIAAGWAALTDSKEPPPSDYRDIRALPADSAPSLAEWLRDSLQAAWHSAQKSPSVNIEPVPASEAEPVPAKPARPKPSPKAGFPAEECALALAGGNQPKARRILKGALEEVQAPATRRLDALRAAAAAAVFEVFEAAARAGIPIDRAWDQSGAALDQIRGAASEPAVLAAAMAALGVIRRRENPGSQPAGTYAALDKLLTERLADGLTLEEAAQVLGEKATTISHRLRRKFGMSYSDYAGRIRVEQAKGLLRRTKLTATEVARRVGIKDQSHFSKVFRRFEGMSPTEYRRRYGKP